jgi:hypothetical protein
VQEELPFAQLASPLAYFFISPQNLPVPLSSIYHTLYHTVLHVIAHALARIRTTHIVLVSYEMALVLEIETLAETIFRAQRKERFALGARGGHVAYATEM